MDEAVARGVDAKLDCASADGVTLASTVLAAFQNGIVADHELLAAVRARRADFMKHTG
ncbi:hypothetical protein NKJ59_04570 [Mesorhizobium australicum]|uniref:hypothetical protein n=1 Tax=Mesorhizobium australicum TaxID=536018 RepID=UPI00333BCE43